MLAADRDHELQIEATIRQIIIANANQHARLQICNQLWSNFRKT